MSKKAFDKSAAGLEGAIASAKGWMLVPVEPTPEMREAACRAIVQAEGWNPDGELVKGQPDWTYRDAEARASYAAALAAAPEPTAQPVAVRVKPLIWEEESEGCWRLLEPFAGVRVQNMAIEEGDEDEWRWRYCVTEYYDDEEFDADSLSMAKEAAEAWWHERFDPIILARVEALPAAEVWRQGAEAMREAAAVKAESVRGVVADAECHVTSILNQFGQQCISEAGKHAAAAIRALPIPKMGG